MAQPIPSLDFMTAVKLAFARLKDMEGRSRRSEFWWTMLAVGICGVVLNLICGAISHWLSMIVLIAIIVVTIPLQLRRLHDTGKGNILVWIMAGIAILTHILSAVHTSLVKKAFSSLDLSAAQTAETIGIFIIILGLASLVIGIILLVFFCQDSQPGMNQYGPSPKYPDFQ